MDCRVLKNGRCEISQIYKGTKHNGVDLVGAGYTLDEVVAHSAGTVVGVVANCNRNTGFAGGAKIYGNYVKIKHDNGMYTFYAHLKYGSVAVALNQRVEKGQILGYMGNTGYSFGAHVHFEVRNKNNVQIDPTQYISGDLPQKIQENIQSSAENTENSAEYIVQAGDTLSAIAVKFGTTVDNLIALNGVEHPKIVESKGNHIETGWVLKIAGNSNATTTETAIKYKVNANSGLWLLNENGKTLKAYVKGTEVEYLEEGYNKYGYSYVKVRVICDNKVGYMAKSYLI